jgi:hypothetical protein
VYSSPGDFQEWQLQPYLLLMVVFIAGPAQLSALLLDVSIALAAGIKYFRELIFVTVEGGVWKRPLPEYLV